MIFNIKQNKGVALIVTILLMSLILFLSLYFLNFSLTEDRIARSQAWGAKTYYLAEAGIAEMIWKLKNDETYKNNFETNLSWTETLLRNNPFGAGSGSYSVTIINYDLARGEITATGSINIGDGTSQRIVKTSVYRALDTGSIDIASSTTFSDIDTDIMISTINIMDGSMHANDDININFLTTVNIDEDLRAVDDYNKDFWSTVNEGGLLYYSGGPNGPASQVNMPPVDFDSADANSLKNRADVIYTEAEFSNLINSSPSPLTLNDSITYVTGKIDTERGKDIIINGLLVADDTITIGDAWWTFCFGGKTSITINHTEGFPSGLISKNDIKFQFCTDVANLNGLLYAADEINVFDFVDNMDIVGTLIARNIDISGILQPIDITYDEGILLDTIGVTEFSPVISIEHWEEEY